MRFSAYILAACMGLGMLVSTLDLPRALAAKNSQKEKSIEEELRLQAGDESGNEVKALKTELLVMRTEKKALEQLEKLKVRYKGTRMEAEVLYRLGEIYMRRARTERFFEVHKDSNQVARFAPAMVRDASEVKQIRRAIETYVELESKFPRFRARDVVVFNTAYAFQQIGDDKKAEEQFKRLLTQHPDSVLVPDAHMSIGEINYARRQFPVALESFLKLKAYPTARVYPYGLYKAAWCRYNMQDENGGIALLEEVIRYGHERVKAASGPIASAKLDLRNEALGDLTLFYSDKRKAEDAVAYFTAQAGDLDPVPVILRLVEIYKRHSKFAEVDVVLRGVLNQLGKSKESPQIALVHEELIWNADRLRRRDIAVQQLEDLVKTCDQYDSKSPSKPTCDLKVIEVSKKLGAKLHANWKKEKVSEVADLALRTYRIYITKQTGPAVFSHEMAQVRYAYADLLFAQGHFRGASREYALVQDVSKDSNRKGGFDLMQTDPKLAVDASYGAVVSLERAVGDGRWSDTDEKSFVQLAASYLAKSPNGPYAIDLKFKKAFIAYEKEKYDEAAPQLKALGWATNSSTTAMSANASAKILKAQDLYLDILNIKKDYKALKESAQALMAMAASAASRGSAGSAIDKTREEHLAKIRREAWFAEIGEIEKSGESTLAANAASGKTKTLDKKNPLLKAVDMYKAFALENKGSELGARAWWNATQILFRVGDVMGGAGLCAEMPTMFPPSENQKQCLKQAAQTYESVARLDLAVKVLGVLAELDPEKKQQWKQTAIDFMALSGVTELKARAASTYNSMIQSEKPEARAAMAEKALEVAREMKDDRTISQIRAKIEAMGLEPMASRYAIEEAELAYRSGDFNRAFNLSKRIVGRESMLSAMADGKGLAARARFLQARVLDDEYRGQSVKARVERIGIVLALKTEKLEKAQKAYQSAAKMGDSGIAIQSYAKLSDLYLDYSKTVKSMKLPADVPEADQKAFQNEIGQIAVPMEEKGIESLTQALEAAKKSPRLDGLAGQLQHKLDALNFKTNDELDRQSPIEVERLPRVVPNFSRSLLGSIAFGSILGSMP